MGPKLSLLLLLLAQGEALPEMAGELVTTAGEVVGRHDGIQNFTVGQRKGLGVATGSALYVIELRGDKKQVVVGGPDELLAKTMVVRRLNWIAIEALREPMRVTVKIRNRHEPAAATISANGADGADAVRVDFEQAQRAITPGQAAVFYDGDVVVGGGWIG